jgi:hypothetical protein
MAAIPAFRKFDHSVTMTVRMKIAKEFYIRKWIALRLIRLAVIVLGCALEVDEGES